MSRLSRAIEHGRKAYFEQKGRPYRTAPHPDFIPYYDVEFFKQLQAHRRQEDEQRWARMKTQLVPIHPPEPELSGSTVDAADPDIPPAQPAPPVPARRGDRHGAAKADQPSSAEARNGFLGWPWPGQ